MNKILYTTSSFGKTNKEPIEIIKKHGYELIDNPYTQKLTEDEVCSLIKEYRPVGILAGLEPLTESVLEEAKQHLKVISRVGVGWDNVDIDAAKRIGIKVFKTENAVTPAVVELTVGLFFTLARHICCHNNLVRKGQWQRIMGTLLQGKTLGIIGCGRIGKGVALTMKSLGCNILVYDLYPDKEWLSSNQIALAENLEELVCSADLLSIHASLTTGNKHLFDMKLFSLAKSNLLIVNTSRGEIIDEVALIQALKEKKIAGAALDVFEHEPYTGELIEFENVVLTPHIGSYAEEVRLQMEKDAVLNLLKGLGEMHS